MTTKKRDERLAEAAPVSVGDVVADKYRIDQLLALGGMGVVALATHEVLGQRVAIKFLTARERGAESVKRFLREARAAAGIRSEHVVRVFDCGKLESGVPYMVMEHLEGIELSKEMRRRGPFEVEEAVDVLLEALVGVAEAHAIGIVHRDLKPSNLFLSDRSGSERVVKVLDFGISKIQPSHDEPVDDDDLTQTSMVLGSPRYISPEQARSSKDVDARADIWSLGVVLYQMLAGEAPFGGDTFGEILTNILLHDPPSLAETRPQVPPALADVVARCLLRDPSDRFDNVAAFAAALTPYGGPRAHERAETIAAILGEPAPLKSIGLREPHTDVRARDADTEVMAPEQPGPETHPPSGPERKEPAPTVDAPSTQSLQAIEGSLDETATRLVPADDGDESPTQGTWAQAQPAPSGRRTSLWVGMVAALALAGGAILGWRFSRSAPAPAPASTASAVAEPPKPDPAPAPARSEAPPAAENIGDLEPEPLPTADEAEPKKTPEPADPAPEPAPPPRVRPPRPVAPPPPPQPVAPPPPPPEPDPASVLERSD